MLKTPIVHLLLLFFAFLPARSFGAKGDLVQFSGFAMTADSLMGVPYAHVTILNRGRVATAGPDGYFSFVGRQGDTLYFTSLGYKPSVYIIPTELEGDKYSVIQLMAKTEYYLKETIIYPWGDKDGFKRAFLDLKLPQDELDRARANMERERLAELGQRLEYDGNEAGDIYARQQAAKFYYYGQRPPMNIFNPMAWAEFIRAWKRGDFRKKD